MTGIRFFYLINRGFIKNKKIIDIGEQTGSPISGNTLHRKSNGPRVPEDTDMWAYRGNLSEREIETYREVGGYEKSHIFRQRASYRGAR